MIMSGERTRRLSLLIKRLFDTAISFTVLTLLAPLLALVVLAIKLEDGGPVFYIQERVGKAGRLFRCYKFRTMIHEAREKSIAEHLIQRDDPRITWVGAFIRDFAIDEVPQLINVLRGDMSLVGPRPTLPYQVERYDARQRRRLEVRPGMTGWAWINGRRTLTWPERIELDIWYVEHRSFWLDLWILIKSFLILIGRKGLAKADVIDEISQPEQVQTESSDLKIT